MPRAVRKKKTPRLTESSDAVQLLRQKFLNGDLKGNEDPKEVWSSNPLFSQYKLPRFRTRYLRLRKEYSSNVCLNPTTTEDPEKGDGIVEDPEEIEDEELETDHISQEDDNPGIEDWCVQKKHWSPLYLMSSWVEPITRRKRTTVAIVLPSGVGSGDFSLSVNENGLYLDLAVVWPTPLVRMDVMHSKWLKGEEMELYHPCITGFESTLQFLRKNVTDDVHSSCCIKLPYKMQTEIDEKHNLRFVEYGGLKMVYVHLKSAMENYAKCNDVADFEDVN